MSRPRLALIALGLWLTPGCADDGAQPTSPALGPSSPLPAPLAPSASPEPEGFTTRRDIDGNPIDTTPGGAVAVLRTEADAVRALGRRVRFEGEASSVDKAPQHVRIGEDFAVACLNWETRNELAGRRVRVTGTLGTTDEFMVRLSPNGTPSQGVPGRVYALQVCEAEGLGSH